MLTINDNQGFKVFDEHFSSLEEAQAYANGYASSVCRRSDFTGDEEFPTVLGWCSEQQQWIDVEEVV